MARLPAGTAFLRDARAAAGRPRRARAAHNTSIHEGQTGTLRVSFAGSRCCSCRWSLSCPARRPAAERRPRRQSASSYPRALDSDQIQALAAGTTDLGLAPLPVGKRRRAEDAGLFPAPRPRWPRFPRPSVCVRARGSSRWGCSPSTPSRPVPRDQAPGYHDLLMTSVTSAGTPPRHPAGVGGGGARERSSASSPAPGWGSGYIPASVFQQLALDGVAYRPVSGAPDTELAALTRRGDRTGLIAARSWRPPPRRSAGRCCARPARARRTASCRPGRPRARGSPRRSAAATRSVPNSSTL